MISEAVIDLSFFEKDFDDWMAQSKADKITEKYSKSEEIARDGRTYSFKISCECNRGEVFPGLKIKGGLPQPELFKEYFGEGNALTPYTFTCTLKTVGPIEFQERIRRFVESRGVAIVKK